MPATLANSFLVKPLPPLALLVESSCLHLHLQSLYLVFNTCQKTGLEACLAHLVTVACCARICVVNLFHLDLGNSGKNLTSTPDPHFLYHDHSDQNSESLAVCSCVMW